MSDKKNELPQTKEEVIDILTSYNDTLLSEALIGIFECRFMMGEDVLTAYKRTLDTHLGIFKDELKLTQVEVKSWTSEQKQLPIGSFEIGEYVIVDGERCCVYSKTNGYVNVRFPDGSIRLVQYGVYERA